MNIEKLQSALKIRRNEGAAAMWACLFFFFVLCAYYVMRPMRESFGSAGGAEQLPFLYAGTLVGSFLLTPVMGTLVTRHTRRRFIPWCYRFFIANLLLFCLGFATFHGGGSLWLGRIFYVWLSVFNLFAVSLFWGFLADGLGLERSKRLFPLIAVGGTLGAIAGAAITSAWVQALGPVPLLAVAALFLEIAVQCMLRLDTWFSSGVMGRADKLPQARTLDLGVTWEGLTLTFRSKYLMAICGYLLLYSVTSTLVYFAQGALVESALSDGRARAALFARIDVWANVVTLVAQLTLAARAIALFGVSLTLAALPLATMLGLIGLGTMPTLGFLMGFQVIRRALNYAFVNPARETLFTVLSRNEKYKAKTFIDTFVYRGGDSLGAAFFSALGALGMGLLWVSWAGAGFATFWMMLGMWLGRQQQRQTG